VEGWKDERIEGKMENWKYGIVEEKKSRIMKEWNAGRTES